MTDVIPGVDWLDGGNEQMDAAHVSEHTGQVNGRQAFVLDQHRIGIHLCVTTPTQNNATILNV